MLKKIWKDPVGSKLISAGLLALVALIYAKVKSVVHDISFTEALHEIYNLKIRLVFVVGIIILYLIITQVSKKNDSY